MNKVILLGRLTKDPELKQSSIGKLYCRFSLAVKKEFVKDGVDFINCVAWEKTAETIANYFSKGNRILIEGKINTGTYESNSGEKRTSFDILVGRINFIESSNNNTTTSNTSNYIDDSDYDENEEFPF